MKFHISAGKNCPTRCSNTENYNLSSIRFESLRLCPIARHGFYVLQRFPLSSTPAFVKASWTACKIDVIDRIWTEIKFSIHLFVYIHRIDSCRVGF